MSEREANQISAAGCEFGDGRFTFFDEPGEHDPCYVVMPGGAMLPLNHDAREGVDVARAKFIIDACNAALSAAPSPVDGGEELGGMIRQSILLSNEHTEAEPSAASDLAQLLRAFDKIAGAVGPPLVRSEAGLHRGTDRLLVVRAHRWKTFAETAAKIAERHRKRVFASPLPLPEPGEGK